MMSIEEIRKAVMDGCFENCHNGVCMRDRCIPREKQQYYCPTMNQEDNAYFSDETIVEKAKLMGIVEGKKEKTTPKVKVEKPVEVVEVADVEQVEVSDIDTTEILRSVLK